MLERVDRVQLAVKHRQAAAHSTRRTASTAAPARNG